MKLSKLLALSLAAMLISQAYAMQYVFKTAKATATTASRILGTRIVLRRTLNNNLLRASIIAAPIKTKLQPAAPFVTAALHNFTFKNVEPQTASAQYEKRYSTTSEEKLYGITAVEFQPPFIKKGLKVLDVGAGDGSVTKKVAQMVGKENIWALEPVPELSKSLVEVLGSSNRVQSSTLQDALKHSEKEYAHAFDVVTIFKYNVPLFERDAFFKALHQTVKHDGEVVITSVEVERFNNPYDVLFLMPTIEQYFSIKEKTTVKDRFNFPRYDLFRLQPKSQNVTNSVKKG